MLYFGKLEKKLKNDTRGLAEARVRSSDLRFFRSDLVDAWQNAGAWRHPLHSPIWSNPVQRLTDRAHSLATI